MSVSSIVAGMSHTFNLSSAKILTAVSAVLAPLPVLDEEEPVSKRKFCDMLGINQKSKYVQMGFDNQERYNAYLNFVEREMRVVGKSVVGQRLWVY